MNVFKLTVNAFMEESEENTDILAYEFQVAPSTVKRWADGIAVPHPRLQELILKWIWESV